MKRVAIIPARGGSKRLPRKNIRPFAGRPIIHYPIMAALASRLFDDVIVSTEDDEIADVARLAGAHTLKRPEELANDTATTGAVVSHAVRYLIEHGAPLEHVCCIYPCTPLILPADLQEGFNKLVLSGVCYVFSVTPYEQHPYRMLHINATDGRVRSVHSEYDNRRNQDLPPRVHDAGNWYWGTADAWLNEIPVYGSWSIGHQLSRWRAIDIDTYDDWVVAEAAYVARLTPTRGAAI